MKGARATSNRKEKREPKWKAIDMKSNRIAGKDQLKQEEEHKDTRQYFWGKLLFEIHHNSIKSAGIEGKATIEPDNNFKLS